MPVFVFLISSLLGASAWACSSELGLGIDTSCKADEFGQLTAPIVPVIYSRENSVLYIDSEALDADKVSISISSYHHDNGGTTSDTAENKLRLADLFRERAAHEMETMWDDAGTTVPLLETFGRITRDKSEATHILKLRKMGASWSSIYQSEDMSCSVSVRLVVTGKDGEILDHLLGQPLNNVRTTNPSVCHNGRATLEYIAEAIYRATRNIRPLTEDRRLPFNILSHVPSISVSNELNDETFDNHRTESIRQQMEAGMKSFLFDYYSPVWSFLNGFSTDGPPAVDGYQLALAGPIAFRFGLFEDGANDVQKRAWSTVPLVIIDSYGRTVKEIEVKDSFPLDWLERTDLPTIERLFGFRFREKMENILIDLSGNICRFHMTDSIGLNFSMNMDEWTGPRIFRNRGEFTRSIVFDDDNIERFERSHINYQRMREECSDTYDQVAARGEPNYQRLSIEEIRTRSDWQERYPEIYQSSRGTSWLNSRWQKTQSDANSFSHQERGWILKYGRNAYCNAYRIAYRSENGVDFRPLRNHDCYLDND